VLKDGRIIVNGGEYLDSASGLTNLGALYDPAMDTWTSVPAPPGCATIGEAPRVVLRDGTYFLADCCGARFGSGPMTAGAITNLASVTWTDPD
jgi:hypothetical protein